jgi:hypothetical protein
LSQTLHSITLTKIRELEKLTASYQSRKKTVLDKVSEHGLDQRGRIACLIEGLQKLHPSYLFDSDVSNISRFNSLAEYDASLGPELLDSYEERLQSHLEIRSREQGLAALYSQLLTEWMEAKTNSDDEVENEDDSSDNFEVIERQKQRLQELCDKFEEVCFTPQHTDKDLIIKTLTMLYEDAGKKGDADLKTFRSGIQLEGRGLVLNTTPFNKETLQWCIKSILDQTLLSEAKQKTLRDFQQNDIVLDEIADVLNMRWQDLENWEWFAGSNGIQVMPRRDLSGKYRIWQDEDVLQAILTQYIGVKWSVALKRTLRAQVQGATTWKEPKPTNSERLAAERWEYFTSFLKPNSYQEELRSQWIDNFLCVALPMRETDYFGGTYNDDENKSEDIGMDKNSGNIKQRLFHRLASELFLTQKIHGEVAVIQTDLQWVSSQLCY